MRSTLSLADMRLLRDTFSRNARVLLGYNDRERIHGVEALMGKNSADFFAWYMEEAHPIITTPVLILELLNNQGQPLKIFRIYRDNLISFQLLKQRIWDTFWTLFSNDESDTLSIFVSVPDSSNRSTGGIIPIQAAITSVQLNEFNCTDRRHQ